MMEEKQRKKREEEEAKEQRKREREEKKEEEKRKKAEERQKREAERKRKAEEKEIEKKKKAELREAERKRKTELKEHRQANKENYARNRKYPTRSTGDGLQQGEISSNECAICFGAYEDDLIDGELSQEWIQCTNESCEKWMHVECLSTNDDGLYVCQVCNNTFA